MSSTESSWRRLFHRRGHGLGPDKSQSEDAARDGQRATPSPAVVSAIGKDVVRTSATSVGVSKTQISHSPASDESRLGLPTRPQQTPTLASASPTLSSLDERLWNQAYDELKANESDIADAYERILSHELYGGDSSSSSLVSQENEIEQDAGQRWSQMEQLIRAGLKRTEKEAAVKQGIEVSMRAVYSVKEVVDKAVKANPQAAVAWVGVCFALEILSNPIAQAAVNREGLAYVVSRMDWYWNLSELLLHENRASESFAGLRNQLEKHLVDLFRKLLLYQMKSVCLYHRNRAVVFLRDLIKLDDWDSTLSEIRDAEAAVRKDSNQYNTQYIRAHLQNLANTAEQNQTKLNDIYLAIQTQSERQERMQEDIEDRNCLRDLRLTDPSDDKKRIEQTKGGLLQDSYRWIFENSSFETWLRDHKSNLLWIRGDPGKGKTMLLCGIIDELKISTARNAHVSYFFCQATDTRINNATAVLQGLIFLLVDQQPSLISHVRKKYDKAGKQLFEDANAWTALSAILGDILSDPALTAAYLIIDALDECVTGLTQLLDFVIQSASSRAKWIVSSRNLPEIEERLRLAEQKVGLSLELNKESVANAVSAYIQQKVLWLAQLKNYDAKTIDIVKDHLLSNAMGTFLWVGLVCQNLEKIPRRKALVMLDAFPPGLNALYERMMDQILELDDNDLYLCQQILAVVTTVYQPLTLHELSCLTASSEGLPDDIEAFEEIVRLCGFFLTICDGTVYFVHQSAKDYLTTNEKACSTIFPFGIEDIHHAIFSRSLRAMAMPNKLRRNMYALPRPGLLIDEVSTPHPDPLVAIRYSCMRWVDHLCEGVADSSNARFRYDLSDSGTISLFLQKHFLHWLEALSLLRSMSVGVISTTRFERLLRKQSIDHQLFNIVQDARRFILHNRWVIENAPLQIYSSALIFSPVKSLIRVLFNNEEPVWIATRPKTESNWSACLQTLEGHSEVSSVAFSSDSKLVASGSSENGIKIWDAATGTEVQTLQGHIGTVSSVAFSSDSKLIASGSFDKTIKIWDATTYMEVQTLQGHSDRVWSVAFSSDSKLIASGSDDETIKIWDVVTGMERWTLQGHSLWVSSVAFSSDSKLVASGSFDKTTKIWNTTTGKEVQTLQGHSDRVWCVAFSSDSKLIASGSDDKTIKLWDATTGKEVQTLQGHSDRVWCVAFSSDSKLIASGSDDKTIKLWDAATGMEMQTLQGHGLWVSSVAFSSDSRLVASGSGDKTIKIWDAATCVEMQTPQGHSLWVNSVAFSSDSRLAASGSGDTTIKIWDSTTCTEMQTLQGHSNRVWSVAFSNDSKLIASGSDDKTIKLWDATTGKEVQTLQGHIDAISSVAFSSDSTLIASGSFDKTIKIWDATTCMEVQTLQGHSDRVWSVAFSSDSKLIASGSDDKTVKLWNATTGRELQTLQGHIDTISSVAFSSDSKLIASGSFDKTIKIWDAATGTVIRLLNVGTILDRLSFNTTSSHLLTDIGSVKLYGMNTYDGAEVQTQTQIQAPDQGVARQGYGLSSDNAWISWNGRNVLWLPPDYRPIASAVSPLKAAIGCSSGRFYTIGFSGPPLL